MHFWAGNVMHGRRMIPRGLFTDTSAQSWLSWPHHKYLINKIESVQKIFTKRLPGLWNLPYSQRLASLNIQSLQHLRILSDLALCYKLQHHYCDSGVADFFKVCSTSITRRNSQKLYKEHCSIDVTKNYFSNRVVAIRNCLPSCVVSASSLNSFKGALHSYEAIFQNNRNWNIDKHYVHCQVSSLNRCLCVLLLTVLIIKPVSYTHLTLPTTPYV